MSEVQSRARTCFSLPGYAFSKGDAAFSRIQIMAATHARGRRREKLGKQGRAGFRLSKASRLSKVSNPRGFIYVEPTWSPDLEIELRVYFGEEADDASSNFGPMVGAIAGLGPRLVESDAVLVDRIDRHRLRARIGRLLLTLSKTHVATLEAAFGGDYEGLNKRDRTTYGDELAAVLALAGERHESPKGRERGARAIKLALARLSAAMTAYSTVREVE